MDTVLICVIDLPLRSLDMGIKIHFILTLINEMQIKHVLVNKGSESDHDSNCSCVWSRIVKFKFNINGRYV